MPGPKNKAEIVKRIQAERRRLEQNLSSLSPEDMLIPGVVGSWSVKDVLAHLADWQARNPVWIAAGRQGKAVECPAPGLTWKQIHILNQRIYEAHCNESLDQVFGYFRTTHDHFMDRVFAMLEEEMMSPGRYAFIGKGAVYNWLSGYAAHDVWGKTKIRKWMRAHQLLEKRSLPPEQRTN